MNQAFDLIAEGYDLSFTFSEIGKLQREIVHNYLKGSIPKERKLNILELNSGTGADALWFAEYGHKVLVTDISEKMLDIVNQKIESKNLSSQVQTSNVDIAKIQIYHFSDKYDLIFSNFGGVNCIQQNELRQLPETIRKLLKDNGRIILVVMSKHCIWESLYFLLKFNLKNAFRRYSEDGVTANLNGLNLKTYYYTPKQIKNMFSKFFDLVAIKPVGFVIPPSYLEKFFVTKKKTLSLLGRIEKYFSDNSFVANFSDHYLIDLQVKK